MGLEGRTQLEQGPEEPKHEWRASRTYFTKVLKAHGGVGAGVNSEFGKMEHISGNTEVRINRCDC